MMRLASAFMGIYFLLIEPLQNACKKKSRLRACKADSLGDLKSCPVNPSKVGDRCVNACPGLIEVQAQSISKFLTNAKRSRPWAARFFGMPALIDLGKYPDFDSYERFLKKKSGGNTLRELQRARASFSSRKINRHAHAEDVHAVENSMLFRTGGPVISAMFTRFFRSSRKVSPPGEHAVHPPACPIHYRMDWGVFIRSDAADVCEEREKLVGYLYLRRVENCLRVMAFMGHGEYLDANVMKLLFADVMKWVLAREDEAVIGLDYLQYGAIEHGKMGLLAWKRKFGFEAAVFTY